MGRLARTLRPEYAQALRAVDIDETPVKVFAQSLGLTPSNAGVRLFRAREALRKQVAASLRHLRRAWLCRLFVRNTPREIGGVMKRRRLREGG